MFRSGVLLWIIYKDKDVLVVFVSFDNVGYKKYLYAGPKVTYFKNYISGLSKWFSVCRWLRGTWNIKKNLSYLFNGYNISLVTLMFLSFTWLLLKLFISFLFYQHKLSFIEVGQFSFNPSTFHRTWTNKSWYLKSCHEVTLNLTL